MTENVMGYTAAGGDPASPATKPAGPSPYPSVQAAAVLADFAKRLGDLEKAVKLQVPSDRITSMIALTKDTALIMADKIGVLGEVTFADWHRDISGQATPGLVDPSITTIRGGTIRTERVLSMDGQSWIDLDATGTTAFIRSRDAVAIYPDGTFRLGGSLGTKTLVWDGANLSLDGSSLIAGTSAGTVVSNAAYGATRSVGDITATVLSNSATAITMTSSQLFRSGSGSAGVFIGAGGIFGKNSLGANTFAIDGATGDASFAGTLDCGNGAIVRTPTLAGAGSTVDLIKLQLPSSAQFGRLVQGPIQSASNAVAGWEFNFSATGGHAGAALGAINTSNNQGARLMIASDGTVYRGTSTDAGATFSWATMPISNGVTQSNLNADMLDGNHASAFASASHTNYLPDIIPDPGGSAVKFQYSTDGSTWTNIYLKRINW